MSTVSVIIPAYNQGNYLGEAIQSVLDQTYPEFEILVVDDGSTDNTADIVHSFDDVRIYYIYQENRGLSASRNTGIRNSKGEYLTFLDSDDLFLPEKLTLLTSELIKKPEVGFVAGQAIPINEHGQRVGKIFDTPLPKDPSRLLMGNPLHVGSVMLRRCWQEKVGYFDEGLRSYEDWDLWLRLGLAGCKMEWIPKPVSLYRFHTAQMTRIGKQMTQATFAVLDKLFHTTDLPKQWRELQDQAYSQAYLRAAAQAYVSGDFCYAKECISRAVALNPILLADNASLLAKQFTAWTELPKVSDPLSMLETVYKHLPGEARNLQKKWRWELSGFSLQRAYLHYNNRDMKGVRIAIMHSLKYHPGSIINRGAWSIFFRSLLP